MQYKALITRMMTVADESLSIIIEDTDTFDSFQTKVKEALTITDHRASRHQKVLLEDTNLTDKLSLDELKAVNTAVELIYPTVSLPQRCSLEQSSFEFAKNLASGEVVKIFLHEVDSYDDLMQAITNIWSLIDYRLELTNQRELDFLEYYKSLDYNTKLKVQLVMDVLFGRSTKEMLESRLTEQTQIELDNYINPTGQTTNAS